MKVGGFILVSRSSIISIKAETENISFEKLLPIKINQKFSYSKVKHHAYSLLQLTLQNHMNLSAIKNEGPLMPCFVFLDLVDSTAADRQSLLVLRL